MTALPHRSGDEIADKAAGEAAFWAANPRDAKKGGWWLIGWDKAATEAALLIQGEGWLVESSKAVREALDGAKAAVEPLIGSKTLPGERRRALDHIAACERALQLINSGPPKKAGSKPAAR